jgi:CRISPR/Cas system-associated exonuclease Cas4 (RecB family)
MKTDIRELVIRGSDILEEGKFDEAERRKWFNASEAMTCIRKQWYSKNGAPKEPEMWGFARRGIHGEKFLVESLIAANVPLTMTGKEQETWKDKKRQISATPDGIIKYDTEWIVPEFKTIDPRTNRSNLPRVKDIVQNELGMALIDQNIDRPDGVTLRGLVIYMDASNYFDILQFDVPFNKNILDTMARKAQKIFRTKDVSNLDREGKRAGGKECKTMCPYNEVCGVHTETAVDRKRANRGSNLAPFESIGQPSERLAVKRVT